MHKKKTILVCLCFVLSGSFGIAWTFAEEIRTASELIRPRDCTSVLVKTLAATLSQQSHAKIRRSALDLSKLAERVLTKPTSRDVFRLYLENFLQVISGVPPQKAEYGFLPHLEVMRADLERALNVKKRPLSGARKRFVAATLSRVLEASRDRGGAQERGRMQYDAWYFLALDYTRAMDFALGQNKVQVWESQHLESLIAKRGAELSGGDLGTLFSPVYLTTQPLLVEDFNESGVVNALLGGLSSRFQRYDGNLSGSPTTFLFRHDLLSHGMDRRWVASTPAQEVLGQFGYSLVPDPTNRFFGDYTLIYAKKAPVSLNAKELESALLGFLELIRGKLERLERLHLRMANQDARTRDAIEVLRFHAEHEYPHREVFLDEPDAYHQHLALGTVVPSDLGATFVDTTDDIVARLKTRYDFGDEYPELARLSYSAIEVKLRRAAQILDAR